MMKGHAALKQAGQEAGVGEVGGADISCGCKSWEKCPMSTGWKGHPRALG